MQRSIELSLLRASALVALSVVCLVTLAGEPGQAATIAGSPSQSIGPIGRPTYSNLNPAETQHKKTLKIATSYGNLPLSFEPNRGQTDSQVKFLSRAANQTLWLTSDGAVLALSAAGTSPALSSRQYPISAAVLRMKFVGATANAVIRGEARQPATINYFQGPMNEWRTNIHPYARVRYGNLYPGIDVVFYGNSRQLEYDMVVSPGADPTQIRLAIEGAEKIRIDADGNLVLKTKAGKVVQQKPKIYQRDGTGLRSVAGSYVITGKHEVRFRLGNYDRRTAVVIDPVLRYSSFLSGSSFDNGSSIAVDSKSRAVVAGETCSPDFPRTGSSAPTGCSAFIVKLNFTGSRLIFAAFLPDISNFPHLALDSSDNIYVTATTGSAKFPTTPGAFQTTFAGDSDATVTKLNSSGTSLIYSTFLGGSAGDVSNGIAVDSSGNAYVTGQTNSNNFPTTAGVFQPECQLRRSGDCVAAFVTKLNASGSVLLYSTYLGGHGAQSGSGIAVDGAGHAFVTGGTDASDFPTTAGTAQPVFAGVTDVFVSQVSSSGSHLNYSTFLGGSDEESGRSIALDSLGNAFVTGTTTSTNFPVKNPFQTFQRHCPDDGTACVTNVFVSKLNPSGRLAYSTYLDGGIIGTSIAVTRGGQAYVAAFTQISTFPVTQTAFQRVLAGMVDITLTKFSPSGKLVFSTLLGGNGGDFDPAVALDRDTNAYMTGTVNLGNSSTFSTFPVTPGAFQQKSKGLADGFVAKIVPLCALSTVNKSVTICGPAAGSSVRSPVRVTAGTTDVTPVKLTQVYLDGHKIFEARLSAISVSLAMPSGTHRLTVQAFDTANAVFKKSIMVAVK